MRLSCSYCGPVSILAADSEAPPSVGLAPWKARDLTRSDTFQTWLEFLPGGGGGQRVPLGFVNWSWSGQALLVGTNGTPGDWQGINLTNSPKPHFEYSENYPFWTNTIGAFIDPMDYKKE
jgi:hypothetical protein